MFIPTEEMCNTLINNTDLTITTPANNSTTCTKHNIPFSNVHNGKHKPFRLVCSQCAVERTRTWRSQHRTQHMWITFIQRAKRKFGSDITHSLNWTTHGYPWITRLLHERKKKMNNKVDVNDLTLVWKVGVSKVGDANDVELVERSNARRRAKPKEEVKDAKVLVVDGQNLLGEMM